MDPLSENSSGALRHLKSIHRLVNTAIRDWNSANSSVYSDQQRLWPLVHFSWLLLFYWSRSNWRDDDISDNLQVLIKLTNGEPSRISVDRLFAGYHPLYNYLVVPQHGKTVFKLHASRTRNTPIAPPLEMLRGIKFGDEQSCSVLSSQSLTELYQRIERLMGVHSFRPVLEPVSTDEVVHVIADLGIEIHCDSNASLDAVLRRGPVRISGSSEPVNPQASDGSVTIRGDISAWDLREVLVSLVKRNLLSANAQVEASRGLKMLSMPLSVSSGWWDPRERVLMIEADYDTVVNMTAAMQHSGFDHYQCSVFELVESILLKMSLEDEYRWNAFDLMRDINYGEVRFREPLKPTHPHYSALARWYEDTFGSPPPPAPVLHPICQQWTSMVNVSPDVEDESSQRSWALGLLARLDQLKTDELRTYMIQMQQETMLQWTVPGLVRSPPSPALFGLTRKELLDLACTYMAVMKRIGKEWALPPLPDPIESSGTSSSSASSSGSQQDFQSARLLESVSA
jgi:hypothetical protein